MAPFSLEYKFYERLAGVPDANAAHRPEFSSAVLRAQHMHALANMDAARDLHFSVAGLAQSITSTRASYFHLMYGATRRTGFVWRAFRVLYSVCPPDRTEPLRTEEIDEASRALNDIYIHLIGTLDNFAWAIIDLFGDSNAKHIREKDVGIFYNSFKNNQSLAPFHAIAASFLDWIRDVKKRRDPVAHRIPLTVPPSVLDEAQQAARAIASRRYDDARTKYIASLGNETDETTRAELARICEQEADNLEKIGTFYPVIVHDPNEQHVPIYPTVPNDIKEFTEISGSIIREVTARFKATSEPTCIPK